MSGFRVGDRVVATPTGLFGPFNAVFAVGDRVEVVAPNLSLSVGRRGVVVEVIGNDGSVRMNTVTVRFDDGSEMSLFIDELRLLGVIDALAGLA